MRRWRIVRIVYCMLGKRLTRRRLVAELDLLLSRGKRAGKAIGGLDGYFSAISCRSAQPGDSYLCPREVEFSCSNSPFYLPQRKSRDQERSSPAIVHSSPLDEALVDRAAEDFIRRFYEQLRKQPQHTA
ncbi:uncharacterized protein LOC144703580 [Wolffia australiana]